MSEFILVKLFSLTLFAAQFVKVYSWLCGMEGFFFYFHPHLPFASFSISRQHKNVILVLSLSYSRAVKLTATIWQNPVFL